MQPLFPAVTSILFPSLTGLVVATLVHFVIGGIWFGPKTLFPLWWRLLGNDPAQRPVPKHPMGIIFSATALAAAAQVATLFVMRAAVTGGDHSLSSVSCGVLGATLALGLSASASLPHRLFAHQGFRVWALECGQDVVSLTCAGFVLGAF